MRVLIGCERSGVIRRAFRSAGHLAFSCDLASADDTGEHLQMDVLVALRGMRWDLAILHPPCTRLCNSGVLRLYAGGKKSNGVDPVKWAEMQSGAAFFNACILASLDIPRLCIENPIPHHHAGLPPYTQTIQPWEFGDPESKRTCLWLRGLPPLVPTNVLPLPECGHWNNQTPSGQNNLGPSPGRAAARAQSYPGIASAMVSQWGK